MTRMSEAADVDLNQHCILIVEDEIVVAMDLADIVRDAGAEVVGPAMSVAEALRLIETHNITGAILDVQLGNDNSLSVAKRLEAAKIPFVLHTGNRSDGWYTGWPQAPILKKPSEPGRLVATLAALATK